jgi:acylphosphatase
MIARHARITGRVQGVFFRQSTSEQARAVGVSGWVRNCADGSVEVHVEGEAAAVNSLVDWLRRGPPSARIDTAEITDAEPRGLMSFEILRKR